MDTDDTPTPISVDDRFHGLPTGNAPRTHRTAKKPTGLNWDEINAQYEANQGVRKEKIWAQGNVVIASRGGVHEQSFVEQTDYEEPPIPPRLPAADPIVVPEGLDQVDPLEELAGETYDEVVDPRSAKAPRYDYDIWTKDPEPTPEPEQADTSAAQPRKGGRQRAFDPEQTAELVRRYQAGESTTTLAEEYDSNHATIWRTLTREGVTLRQQGPPTGRAPAFTREQEADLVRRYNLGESMESIAAEYNTYATTVRRALLRNGVTLRPRGAPRHTEPQASAETTEAPDLQAQVIADIEARRPAKARHAHAGHDYLELLYHGLIDSLLDLKQVLNDRDAAV